MSGDFKTAALPPEIGRLAMRVEGDWWVAYYAVPTTMDDALELGRLHMSIAHIEARKQAFMDLMAEAVGDLIEGTTGMRPSFTGFKRAPEHERSGHA